MTDRDYDCFAAEHEALLQRSGYVALTDWSIVSLSGADRQSFLHNMCTNDIRKLARGEGCEAFCTDVKGRIVAHVWVLVLEVRITLLAVPNQAQRIVSHLDRYIIREDVQLADETAKESWTVLAGPQVGALLGGADKKLNKPWQCAICPLGDVECMLVRFPLPDRDAFLLGTAADHAEVVHKQLSESGAVACDLPAWTALRVETGLPLFGVDFDESNLPQEVARDAEAISFTKGCYLGQETIARIDALGHVNKQLVTLKFAEGTTPKANTPLLQQENQVGVATSIAQSIRSDATLALGMVRRGSNDVGAKLESTFGQVEVISTPAFND